ncbi:hypothetical protein [Streptococcus constellatus]|uniref:hypothetical protein n=1 Tax=Streptococcus constellatus TaxID=76860 RepID=UPI00200112B5|nr:hypothetical protein [Streptococcus constellatus]
MNQQTNFLMTKNSFVSGMARVVDIGSKRNKKIYITSKSGDEADKKAILNDWTMIGKDIWGAYDKFKQENQV